MSSAYSFRQQRRKIAGLDWVVHEKFAPDLADLLGRCAFMDGSGDSGMSWEGSGRSTTVVRDGWKGHGNVVMKLYAPRALGEFSKYLLRRTRAAAEWRMNAALREHDLPTATPLAWGERRFCRVWLRSVLILEEISPGQTVADYLSANVDGRAASALVAELARVIARLHNAGFHYRDLHGENLILGGQSNGVPAVYFVDLHEVRQIGRATRRTCIDDLGRLNAYVRTPGRNRVLFLKTYFAERGLPLEEWQEWARAIDSRSRALWERHYRKRGNRIDTY